MDEQGRFSTRGPDFEGQMRLLRAGDGVHFTKFGARKLAHYVERELRRVLSATPVALTTPEPAQQQAALRRAAGETVGARRSVRSPVRSSCSPPMPTKSDELLGGGAQRAQPPHRRSGRVAACWSRARRSPSPPAAPTILPGRRACPI